MTRLGVSAEQWFARSSGAFGVYAAALGLAMAVGCASQSPSGGVGGQTTTTTTTSSSGKPGTGGSTSSSASTGASGGAGGGAVTSSSSSSGASSSSSSSGVGGVGGAGGTGGAGGVWVPPVGSADYPAEMEQNNLTSTANPLPPGAKGFTASIWPEGDVDVFSFEVVTAGTSATITTSNGMGGCPPGAKTYVRVYDSNNTVLATDPGQNGCVHLTPAANPSLAGLDVGTYYVHVESGDIAPIPFYILDIALAAPSCGDGIVQIQIGEQCDDGNNVSGDGCSATCQLENGPYLDETEPNDTQATGNLLDGYVGAVGQINPIGDVDYYTFDVTVAGSSVTAVTSDGHGGCPAGFDSKIYLFSPAMVQIAADDDGGVAPCSKIDPIAYPAAADLPVGLYAIEVQRFDNEGTSPYYVLNVKVTPPSCGDGILQAGEQCDDGNNVNGDGCSSTCQFEADYVYEMEPNDTQALANPLPMGAAGFIASINPVGDLDYFSFPVVVPGSSVTIATSDGLHSCPAGFDSQIYLFDPNHVQIAYNDDGPLPPCSQIAPATDVGATNLAVGTYTVRVQRYGNNAIQAQYVVTIHVAPPGCGDGLVEAGEQCDDGPNNGAAGDGCSATCQALSPYEIEPNNSTAMANSLWPGTSTWKGAINPIGDHDYFTFTLPAIGSPTLVTHAADSPATCGFDTVIHLLDHNGVQIVQDDDGGIPPCSKISPALYPQVHNLPAGVYYVWVQHYGDSQTIPLYQLDLGIQ